MECGLAMFLVVAMHFFVDTGAFSSGSGKARGFGYFPVCVPPKSSLVLGRLIPAIFQVYLNVAGTILCFVIRWRCSQALNLTGLL